MPAAASDPDQRARQFAAIREPAHRAAARLARAGVGHTDLPRALIGERSVP